MKICEDCIHYHICEHVPEYANNNEVCLGFKDKSKFIELPCSIGDTVYAVAYNEIFEAKVICIRPFVFKHYVEFRGNVTITMIDPFYSDGRSLTQELFVVFGEDVFLTREEAEKKLIDCLCKLAEMENKYEEDH